MSRHLNNEDMIDPRHGSSLSRIPSSISGFCICLDDLEELLLSDAPQTAKMAAQLAEEAMRDGDWQTSGEALCIQAAALFYQNQFEESGRIYTEVLHNPQFSQEFKIIVRSLNGLGNIHKMRREFPRAIQYFYKSAKKAAEAEDKLGWHRSMNSIGLTYTKLGNFDEAEEIHELLLSQAEYFDMGHQIWVALINLLSVMSELNKYQEILNLCTKYLVGTDQNKIPAHCLFILRSHYVCSLTHTGNHKQAYAMGQSMIDDLRRIEDYDALSWGMLHYGYAAMKLGKYEKSFELFTESLDIAKKYGYINEEILVRYALSQWYEANGYFRDSNNELRIVIELEQKVYEENHYSVELKELYEQLSTLEKEVSHVKYKALHDPLTGLPNRTYFQQRVSEALVLNPEKVMAVVFVDLDNFKRVNDTYGHEKGDELLRQVSERLQSELRFSDFLARLGGDEFTILLNDIEDAADAIRYAQRLLDILSLPFHITDQPIFMTASLGIAMSPQDGYDVATLQRHADQAMYCVKHTGKNSVHVFMPQILSE